MSYFAHFTYHHRHYFPKNMFSAILLVAVMVMPCLLLAYDIRCIVAVIPIIIFLWIVLSPFWPRTIRAKRLSPSELRELANLGKTYPKIRSLLEDLFHRRNIIPNQYTLDCCRRYVDSLDEHDRRRRNTAAYASALIDISDQFKPNAAQPINNPRLT